MSWFFGEPVDSELNRSQFAELYASCEVRLRGYVQSLVPRWSDADDILQKCNLIIWQKFDQFEPGTNFFAWACQIARFQVLKYREAAARDKLVFSEDFIDAVAQHTVRSSDEIQNRIDFLQECVAKLSPEHRELLRLSYEEERTTVSIAKHLKRGVDGVYKALRRIHLALHLCVTRRLTQGQT